MTFQNNNEGFELPLAMPIGTYHYEPLTTKSIFFWLGADRDHMGQPTMQRDGDYKGSYLGHWNAHGKALHWADFGAWLARKNFRPKKSRLRPRATLTGLFARYRRAQTDISSSLEGPRQGA